MTRWPRIALLAAATLALLTLGACAWHGLRGSDAGIQKLYLIGTLGHVGAPRITKTLQPYLQHGYADLPVERARTAIEALPWVAAASVYRRWPNAIVIRVREYHAVARWNQSDLLAADGSTFKVPAGQRPEDLVQLAGPAGSAAAVQTQLQHLQALLEPAHMRIAALRRNVRGGWQLRLASGLELKLGTTDCHTRLQRFISHLNPTLRRQLEDSGYVDLRYAYGFAVGGKPAHTGQTASRTRDHDKKA